jgi:outer membrane protein assembly factor BamB
MSEFQSQHDQRRLGSWHAAGAGLVLAAALLVTACGGGSGSGSGGVTSAPASTNLSAGWGLPGADLQNSRAVGGPIDSSTVSKLGVAWTVPIAASGAFGGYATTPVVVNGVVYTQDLASNVEAIDFKTGKVLWTHRYKSASVGPNGVNVANGTVYGATADSAFALSAATGKQLWIRKLTRNANEGIDMAPGYNNGTVYVSTVPGTAKVFYAGDGQAILSALDASTGAVKWRWAEVPPNLWSRKHKNINSGGGQWNPPSFDSAGNLYVGVSNPAPFTGTPKFPWGSSRPGPDLYTNSIVKLDPSSGKPIWHYQLTPHDIYDWDLQNPPLLATVNGRQIVIDGGKAGIVVAVDAQTGKPIWKRPVGVHNGHDNDNLAAQRGDFSKLHIPETIEPGDLGGIESPLATNGKTVFAAVNNLPTTYKGQGLKFAIFAPPSKGTGDFVAIDATTGKVKWDVKLKSSPYGAATIANDVVFTTTFDGTLHGFNVDTGKQIFSTKLSAGTNAPVAINDDTLITAGTLPGGRGQKALIIAYRLGATGKLPGTTPATTPTPAPHGSGPASSPSSLKLAAKGNQLLFNTDKLTAKAGKVTIDFANNSALQHNVTLVSSGNKILGKTPTFAGGSKSFSATLKAGTYTYYCSVPGHRQAGMQGTLTVK